MQILNQQWMTDTIHRADVEGNIAARISLVKEVSMGGTIDHTTPRYWPQLALIAQYAKTFDNEPALVNCYDMARDHLEIKGEPKFPYLVDMILVECGDNPETLDFSEPHSARRYFIAHRGCQHAFRVGNLDVLNVCAERLAHKDGSKYPELAPLVFEIALAMKRSLECKDPNVHGLYQLASMSGDTARACRLIKCAFPDSYNPINRQEGTGNG